jgi:CRISPR/Cas system CSM-associated protein Csm3 (group 7 of RAMP superfamily)
MKIRRLEIRFQEPFHHGSGFGIAGLVDRAVLRDSEGTPYLSGSAVKGKFRHAALRLLLSKVQPACEYGDNPRSCEPCPLCLIFGSRVRPGALLFSDAWPNDEQRNVLRVLHRTTALISPESHVRPGVSLDRGLGTARNQLLFSSETLPAFLVFQSTISGDLADSRLEELLKESSQVLTHFGAGSSRGLGHCQYRFLENL